MTITRQPIDIVIDTPNYVVRTLRESDDMGRWGEWIADPHTARMLNTAVKTLTADDFKAYVRRFDRINSHCSVFSGGRTMRWSACGRTTSIGRSPSS